MQNESTNAQLLANPCYRMPKFISMLFSTPMVEALINRSKLQTRRIVKYPLKCKTHHISICKSDNPPPISFCPIEVGDIIWVRETWQKDINFGYIYKQDILYNNPYEWAFRDEIKYKPSLFMPKSACRIFLEVVDIRCEKLIDISHKDAIAEGIEPLFMSSANKFENGQLYKNYLAKPDLLNEGLSPIHSYKSLWESINGKDSWHVNTYVWVYTFKVLGDVPVGFR
jgi:hypothetical protein